MNVPEMISHDALLVALELKSLDLSDLYDSPDTPDGASSVYRMQLRHSLLNCSRRAHLAVAAHEATGLPEGEIAGKSTVDLLLLLDQNRADLS